jgi:hypothetical protein
VNLPDRTEPVYGIIARVPGLEDTIHELVNPHNTGHNPLRNNVPSTDITCCQRGLRSIALAIQNELGVGGKA